MTKKEFLKVLEKELMHQQAEDITSIMEYYDELIEDKKESGKNEKDVIGELSITDIVRNVKVHRTIEDAVQKPTLSNGMKALIAFLGILSFPMLIVVMSLVFVLFILVFVAIIVSGALLFAAVMSVIAMVGALVTGQLPVFTALFVIGAMLVLSGIFSLMFKWILIASKRIMSWFIDLINRKFRKKVETNG